MSVTERPRIQGNATNSTRQSLFEGSIIAKVKKKALCGSRGRCRKYDKLLQVTSFKAENYKNYKKKNQWSERSEPSVSA